MKIAPGMHVEWVEGEAVILNPENGDLHYLNGPAAKVYAYIEEHGFEKALAELRVAYGNHANFEQELADVLKDMAEKGLLLSA